jgi:membrane-associated protease RseP (regulator of RpoE activity)
MRKLSACLVGAILGLAPTSALAESKQSDPWQQVDHFEWSTSQGRLGVMVTSMTPELRQYFAAPIDRGVLVVKVEGGSPAAKAGIKVGDVIVSVRGQSVDDARDVIEALADAKQGDNVALQLVRDKKTLALQATMTSSSTLSSFGWLREAFPWLDFAKLPRRASSS